MLDGGFDAIITNAGGCGSTLKEYGELLEHDPEYAEKARRFSALVKDVNEFLASIELNPPMHVLPLTVTYQDSCHLAHGQKIRSAPRKLLESIAWARSCGRCSCRICAAEARAFTTWCTPSMAMSLLEKKMEQRECDWRSRDRRVKSGMHAAAQSRA